MGAVAHMSSRTKGAAAAPICSPNREHSACRGGDNKAGGKEKVGSSRVGSERGAAFGRSLAGWDEIEGRSSRGVEGQVEMSEGAAGRGGLVLRLAVFAVA